MKRERRWGLQLHAITVWVLVIFVLIALLASAWLRRPDEQVVEIAAATAVVVLVFGTVTYRSRTLWGWLRKRMTYRRSHRRPVEMFPATSDAAHTWDGERANVYVELLPQPYEVTLIGTEAETTDRPIPVDAIREELTQFDIKCDRVTLVTFAYKYAEPSALATTSHSVVGPVGAMLYGRTVLEVSVALDGSLDSLYARQGHDGIAAGLSRTVSVAAERIRRRVKQLGWNAVVLGADEVEELQKTIGEPLAEQIEHERWGGCGASTMQASVFTPGNAAWTAANYREWLKLNTHRHLEILRLSRRRDGNDRAELYLGYLTNDPSTLNTVRAIGLRREYGQQGDILTAAMPSMRTAPISAVPGKTLRPDEPFPVPLNAGGVGTFIGLTKTRAQVFVNFAVGNEPFYVVAPGALCQQLLLRLATSGLSIDINLPGEEWELFARRIGASYQQRPDADVVLTAQDGLTRQAKPRQVRLVWMTTEPRRIDYGIVAGRDECVLTTPSGQTRYSWSVSSAEEGVFTMKPSARTSAPRQPVQPPQRQPLPSTAPLPPRAPRQSQLSPPPGQPAQRPVQQPARAPQQPARGPQQSAQRQPPNATPKPPPPPPLSSPGRPRHASPDT